jgi:hypothetical protein
MYLQEPWYEDMDWISHAQNMIARWSLLKTRKLSVGFLEAKTCLGFVELAVTTTDHLKADVQTPGIASSRMSQCYGTETVWATNPSTCWM